MFSCFLESELIWELKSGPGRCWPALSLLSLLLGGSPSSVVLGHSRLPWVPLCCNMPPRPGASPLSCQPLCRPTVARPSRCWYRVGLEPREENQARLVMFQIRVLPLWGACQMVPSPPLHAPALSKHALDTQGHRGLRGKRRQDSGDRVSELMVY